MDAEPSVPTLADLIEEHSELLYRYAYRLCGSAPDAEDLTQQAFLTAHRKLGQLREPEHARSWLCTILRNAFLKGLRKRPSGPVVSLETVPEPSQDPPPDAAVDSQELQEVLNELPEEFRTTLILFYFEEFSYKDIAEQMQVPIGTVMSRLSRGKSHLRERLASRAAAAATERQ